MEVPDSFQSAPDNYHDVISRLHAIQKQKQNIEQLNELKKVANEFYEKRIEKTEQQIERLYNDIAAYMSLHGQERLPTHMGTLFFQTRKQVEWLEEKELLDWTIKNYPEAIINKNAVSKTSLNKLFKEHGMPSWYKAIEVRKLVHRIAEEDVQNNNE